MPLILSRSHISASMMAQNAISSGSPNRQYQDDQSSNPKFRRIKRQSKLWKEKKSKHHYSGRLLTDFSGTISRTMSSDSGWGYFVEVIDRDGEK